MPRRGRKRKGQTAAGGHEPDERIYVLALVCVCVCVVNHHGVSLGGARMLVQGLAHVPRLVH